MGPIRVPFPKKFYKKFLQKNFRVPYGSHLGWLSIIKYVIKILGTIIKHYA